MGGQKTGQSRCLSHIYFFINFIQWFKIKEIKWTLPLRKSLTLFALYGYRYNGFFLFLISTTNIKLKKTPTHKQTRTPTWFIYLSFFSPLSCSPIVSVLWYCHTTVIILHTEWLIVFKRKIFVYLGMWIRAVFSIFRLKTPKIHTICILTTIL